MVDTQSMALVHGLDGQVIFQVLGEEAFVDHVVVKGIVQTALQSRLHTLVWEQYSKCIRDTIGKHQN